MLGPVPAILLVLAVGLTQRDLSPAPDLAHRVSIRVVGPVALVEVERELLVGGEQAPTHDTVVDLDLPVVFVLPGRGGARSGANHATWDDAIRQALRVGHESVAGYLEGGLDAWIEAGLLVESNGRLSVIALARALDRGGSEAPLVIDVRQPSEYAEGHLTGAWHIGAGDLPGRLADLPHDRPIATMCASGYRASVAASLLDAAGFTNVSSVAGGVDAWAERGLPLERSRG